MTQERIGYDRNPAWLVALCTHCGISRPRKLAELDFVRIVVLGETIEGTDAYGLCGACAEREKTLYDPQESEPESQGNLF